MSFLSAIVQDSRPRQNASGAEPFGNSTLRPTEGPRREEALGQDLWPGARAEFSPKTPILDKLEPDFQTAPLPVSHESRRDSSKNRANFLPPAQRLPGKTPDESSVFPSAKAGANPAKEDAAVVSGETGRAEASPREGKDFQWPGAAQPALKTPSPKQPPGFPEQEEPVKRQPTHGGNAPRLSNASPKPKLPPPNAADSSAAPVKNLSRQTPLHDHSKRPEKPAKHRPAGRAESAAEISARSETLKRREPTAGAASGDKESEQPRNAEKSAQSARSAPDRSRNGQFPKPSAARQRSAAPEAKSIAPEPKVRIGQLDVVLTAQAAKRPISTPPVAAGNGIHRQYLRRF